MSMAREIVTAVRTLTILRIPGREAERRGTALKWFPFIGLLVGGITICLGWAVLKGVGTVWPACVALIMLMAGIVITGGMHLDGLADTVDALGAGRDRARALAVMKDPHIGTFGVLALILAVLGKWIFYFHLVQHDRLHWIVVACVLARQVQVHLAARQPYARSEGMAADFVRQATDIHLIIAAGFTLAIILSFCDLSRRTGAAILASMAVAMLWGAFCRRRFGGITGDTIGAGSEITELVVLLIAAWR